MFELLAHRAWNPPPSSSLAEEERPARSSVRRRAICRRSQRDALLAHRAWNPPPSSSLAEEERLRLLLLRAAARDLPMPCAMR